MEVTFKDNSEMSMEEQIDVRHRVIEGLNQINQGNTKDFNAVCEDWRRSI